MNSVWVSAVAAVAMAVMPPHDTVGHRHSLCIRLSFKNIIKLELNACLSRHIRLHSRRPAAPLSLSLDLSHSIPFQLRIHDDWATERRRSMVNSVRQNWKMSIVMPMPAWSWSAVNSNILSNFQCSLSPCTLGFAQRRWRWMRRHFVSKILK